MHTGLGIFFTILTLELTLGKFEIWARLDLPLFRTIGFLLYIPAAYLVVASMHALKYRGKADKADFTASTTFIDRGIYGLVRQPMTLGIAIWSLALVLVFQSLLSLILGVSAIFCFWMSARKEVEYNIRKFGKLYGEYVERVPMWNIIRGWRRRPKTPPED
jgi:protein-S-isoprenylcysteine O-methyltransferase Ste14